MRRLEGKVAVITGAASGIGLGTLERFVDEGARVIAADIQDDKASTLVARFGDSIAYCHCDVRDEAQIKSAIDMAVQTFGGLDILFNNAGAVLGMEPIEELDVDLWRSTFELHVTSAALGIKHAIAPMRMQGGGSIINTSSVAGIQAGAGPMAYSSAKAAVLHMSRVAAAELAAYNIRVNAVLPGLIATSIFGVFFGLDVDEADQMATTVSQRIGAFQPVARSGEPSDVASAVAYLASSDAGFVTGTHIIVDGGITVGPRHSWDRSAISHILEMVNLDREAAEK